MNRSHTPHIDDTAASMLTWPVVSVSGRATLRAVAEALSADDVGAVLVTENGVTVGIVSERDVVRHLAANAYPDHVLADEMMSDELVTVAAEDTLRSVAEVMLTCDVRHLPVTAAGEITGMLSMRDLHRVLLGELGA